jgi:hypothetical protein
MVSVVIHTDSVEIEKDLFDEFGPYAPVARIWKHLSYSSPAAARQAALKSKTPIPCLTLPHRRGRFVRVRDLADWLSKAAEP